MADAAGAIARAQALIAGGAYTEAAALLADAVAGGGDDAFEAAILRGRVLIAANHLAEAIEALQAALSMAAPDGVRTARVLVQLAIASERLGAGADAATLLGEALKLDPELVEARTALARLHAAAERFEDAEAVLAPALEAAPADEGLALARAEVLAEAGRLEEARACLETLLARCPESGEALANLGNVLRDQGDLKGARARYDAALRVLAPPSTAYARARVNRAMVRLIESDYRGGWEDYEFRLRLPEARATDGLPPPFTDERGDLGATRLLVYPEQGIGDIVMFATLLPEAVNAGADIRLWVPERLQALFARSLERVAVETDPGPDEQGSRAGRADAALAIGSLPRLFRPRKARFNGRGPRPGSPLLKPDPGRVTHWRGRLAEMGKGPHVGIAWRGGASPWDRRLRRTAPEDWRGLLADGSANYVSLQFGAGANEVGALARGAGGTLHAIEDVGQDLDAFAALIAALDGVVSMDNSTVHFAGALARPVVTLVPHVPTWRWGESGGASLWYPTMRIVRGTPGPVGGSAWADAITRAGALVGALIERSTADT